MELGAGIEIVEDAYEDESAGEQEMVKWCGTIKGIGMDNKSQCNGSIIPQPSGSGRKRKLAEATANVGRGYRWNNRPVRNKSTPSRTTRMGFDGVREGGPWEESGRNGSNQ